MLWSRSRNWTGTRATGDGLGGEGRGLAVDVETGVVVGSDGEKDMRNEKALESGLQLKQLKGFVCLMKAM